MSICLSSHVDFDYSDKLFGFSTVQFTPSQLIGNLWIVLLLLLFSPVQLFATPWTASCQASLSFTISQRLLKLMSIELMMPSNHPIPYHPLLLLPSIFPSIRVFLMSRLFSSNDQNIGASALILQMNIKGGFPLELTGLISMLSKGLSRLFFSTIVWKHQFFSTQPFLWSNSHIHTWLLDKTMALTIWTFVGKVMSLLFNMLTRFVIAFLPRSKHFLISWLQSLFTEFWSPRK